MVNRILEVVGVLVLFYGGLYSLLATIGLVAYLTRRALGRTSDRAVVYLTLATGKNHGAHGEISAAPALSARHLYSRYDLRESRWGY